MSILIKGMKMPENCMDCKLTDSEYCTCVLMDFYNDDYYVGQYHKERAPFCPLVEVPASHGRLIDADKLLKKGITLSWSVQKWMSEVDIGLMPTIIEAEEGENHE